MASSMEKHLSRSRVCRVAVGGQPLSQLKLKDDYAKEQTPSLISFFLLDTSCTNSLRHSKHTLLMFVVIAALFKLDDL